MSLFTQISATLINEKYCKGHSQAGISKIKAMGMLRLRKMGRAVYMCMCAIVWVLVYLIRKQVEAGRRGSSLEHAVLGVRTSLQHLCACSLLFDNTLSKGFIMRKCMTFSSHIYDLL